MFSGILPYIYQKYSNFSITQSETELFEHRPYDDALRPAHQPWVIEEIQNKGAQHGQKFLLHV